MDIDKLQKDMVSLDITDSSNEQRAKDLSRLWLSNKTKKDPRTSNYESMSKTYLGADVAPTPFEGIERIRRSFMPPEDETYTEFQRFSELDEDSQFKEIHGTKQAIYDSKLTPNDMKNHFYTSPEQRKTDIEDAKYDRFLKSPRAVMAHVAPQMTEDMRMIAEGLINNQGNTWQFMELPENKKSLVKLYLHVAQPQVHKGLFGEAMSYIGGALENTAVATSVSLIAAGGALNENTPTRRVQQFKENFGSEKSVLDMIDGLKQETFHYPTRHNKIKAEYLPELKEAYPGINFNDMSISDSIRESDTTNFKMTTGGDFIHAMQKNEAAFAQRQVSHSLSFLNQAKYKKQGFARETLMKGIEATVSLGSFAAVQVATGATGALAFGVSQVYGEIQNNLVDNHGMDVQAAAISAATISLPHALIEKFQVGRHSATIKKSFLEASKNGMLDYFKKLPINFSKNYTAETAEEVAQGALEVYAPLIVEHFGAKNVNVKQLNEMFLDSVGQAAQAMVLPSLLSSGAGSMGDVKRARTRFDLRENAKTLFSEHSTGDQVESKITELNDAELDHMSTMSESQQMEYMAENMPGTTPVEIREELGIRQEVQQRAESSSQEIDQQREDELNETLSELNSKSAEKSEKNSKVFSEGDIYLDAANRYTADLDAETTLHRVNEQEFLVITKGGYELGLRIGNVIQGADATYDGQRNIINIPANMEQATFTHEMSHAAVNLGILESDEIADLEAKAIKFINSKKYGKYKGVAELKSRYEAGVASQNAMVHEATGKVGEMKLTDELLQDELIAHMVEAYRSGEVIPDERGTIRKILNYFQDAFHKLGVMRQSTHGLTKDLASGKVWQRELDPELKGSSELGAEVSFFRPDNMNIDAMNKLVKIKKILTEAIEINQESQPSADEINREFDLSEDVRETFFDIDEIVQEMKDLNDLVSTKELTDEEIQEQLSALADKANIPTEVMTEVMTEVNAEPNEQEANIEYLVNLIESMEAQRDSVTEDNSIELNVINKLLKINPSSLPAYLKKGVSGDIPAYWLSKDGVTIDAAAHNVWENLTDDMRDQYNDTDVKNIIEEIIQQGKNDALNSVIGDPQELKDLNKELTGLVERNQVGMRFALKQVADENNLIAVHNLSAENLLHVNKMGALPAPSIAIVDSHKADFSSFGEISLIAKSKLVDNSADSTARTFDADIYSPRQPRATYKINKATAKALESIPEIRELNSYIDDSTIESKGYEGLASNDAMKLAYERSKGRMKTIPMTKVTPIPKALKGKIPPHTYSKEFEVFAKSEEFRSFHKSSLEDKYKARKDDGDLVDRLMEMFDDSLNRDNFIEAQNIVNAIKAGAKKSIDKSKLRDKLRKVDEAKVEAWLKVEYPELIDKEVMYAGTDNNGRARYRDYTLDNIVKKMTASLRGGEGVNYGVGSIRAGAANELKNVKDIKARKSQLATKAEVDAFKEASSNDFGELAEYLKKFYKYGSDSFGYFDGVSEALQEYAQKGRSSDFEGLNAEAKGKISDFLNELKEAPTEYFESKIQRAVNLSEFELAMIPKGASFNESAKILKESGVKILRYNKEEGRDLKDNRLNNIRFSLAPPTDSKEFKKWFGDSKVVNEDGSPKVVYHGTAREFTEFSKKKSDDKTGRSMRMGWGGDKYYFTDSEQIGKIASEGAVAYGKGNKPNVMEVYLKAESPIDADEYSKRLGTFDNVSDRDKALKKLDKELISEGYDSIAQYYKGKIDGAIAVFEPNQIKSATENSGEYSKDNNDIRFSLAQDKSPERTKTLEEARKILAGESSIDEPAQTIAANMEKHLGDPRVNKNEDKALRAAEIEYFYKQKSTELKTALSDGSFRQKVTQQIKKDQAKEREFNIQGVRVAGLDDWENKFFESELTEELAAAQEKELDSLIKAEMIERGLVAARNKHLPKGKMEYREMYKKAVGDLASRMTRELVPGRLKEKQLQKIRTYKKLTTGPAVIKQGRELIKAINYQRIKEDRKTLYGAFQTLIGSSLVKKNNPKVTELIKSRQYKDFLTDEIIVRDLEPEVKHWLQLVGQVSTLSEDKTNALTESLKDLNNKDEGSESTKLSLAGLHEDFKALKNFDYLPRLDQIMLLTKALDNYGNLKNRSVAEISDAIDQVHDEITGSIEKLTKMINERVAKNKADRALLVKAITPTKEQVYSNMKKKFFNVMAATFSFRTWLETSIKNAPEGDLRDNASGLIKELLMDVQRADNAQTLKVKADREAFEQALTTIYKQPHYEALNRLNKKSTDLRHLSNLNNELSIADVMKLYGSFVQDNYTSNALEHERDIASFEKVLSEQDMELVEWFRQYYRDARPELDAKHYATTGNHFPAAEENYLPFKASMLGGLPTQIMAAQIVPPSMNDRVKHSRDAEEEQSIIDIFLSKTVENAHYLTHVDLSQRLRGLFGAEDYQTAFTKAFGSEALTDFQGNVIDMINGKSMEFKSKIGTAMRNGFVFSKFSYNARIALKQTTSLYTYALNDDVSISDVTKYIAHSVRTMFSDETRQLRQEIMTHPLFKARKEGGNSEELASTMATMQNPIARKLMTSAMTPIMLGDSVPILLVGQGIYAAKKNMLIEKGYSDKAAIDEAMTYMMMLTQESQQSSQLKDQSIWQRRGGDGTKFFAMFTNTTRQYLEKNFRAGIEAQANWQDKKGKLGKTVLINHLIAPMLYNGMNIAINALLGDEPDEDDFWMMAAAILAGPLSGYVLLGSIATNVTDYIIKGKKNRYKSLTPIDSLLDDSLNLKDVMSPFTEEELRKAALNQLMKSYVAPYREASKVKKNYYD